MFTVAILQRATAKPPNIIAHERVERVTNLSFPADVNVEKGSLSLMEHARTLTSVSPAHVVQEHVLTLREHTCE